ncbi:MAG: hypothetical protein ACUVXJ_11295 [Phycisphaerae bacterium]
MAILLDNVSRLCALTYPLYLFDVTYPPYPSLPPNATPGSQAMKDFEAAVAQWNQQVANLHRRWQLRHQEWRSRKPFLVRHDEAIIAFLCTVGSAWFLWALLRAIGARRTIASVRRPPTCEHCGYNLTGTTIEGRCPECGTPAIESLGPHVRPGTEWDRGGGLKDLVALCHHGNLRSEHARASDPGYHPASQISRVFLVTDFARRRCRRAYCPDCLRARLASQSDVV